MSKELTPLLEAFYDLLSPIGLKEEGLKRYYLIETALKDYEQRLALAKEYKDVDKVAKRLKALEIIKEKRVDVDLFLWADNVEYYNKYCNKYINVETQLTPEEYELLKEVML